MEVLVVGPWFDLGSGDSVMLGGVAHPLKGQARSLGVLLNLTPLLDKQVASVARSDYCQIRRVC